MLFRSYCIAHGTLLNVMWHLGCKGSLEGNCCCSVAQSCPTLSDPMVIYSSCSPESFLSRNCILLAQTWIAARGARVESSCTLQPHGISGRAGLSQHHRRPLPLHRIRAAAQPFWGRQEPCRQAGRTLQARVDSARTLVALHEGDGLPQEAPGGGVGTQGLCGLENQGLDPFQQPVRPFPSLLSFKL